MRTFLKSALIFKRQVIVLSCEGDLLSWCPFPTARFTHVSLRAQANNLHLAWAGGSFGQSAVDQSDNNARIVSS